MFEEEPTRLWGCSWVREREQEQEGVRAEALSPQVKLPCITLNKAPGYSLPHLGQGTVVWVLEK